MALRLPRKRFIALLCSVILLGCGLTSSPLATAEIHPTESPVPATATPSPAPEPTETPVPSPTHPPTATAAPPKVLYQEQFDDETTCFRLHTFEPGVVLGIDAGQYHVRIDVDTVINLACTGGYDDFVMDFDLTFSESNLQSILGLSFRIYVGTSYNLYLNGSNEYCWDFIDFNKDLFFVLAGCWQPLPMDLDLGSQFKVTIIAAGEYMAILINDVAIAVAADRTNDYGSFSFFIAHEGQGATEVILDNIFIREVTEGDLTLFRGGQTGY